MPEVISPELRQVLRRLHRSPLLETLPERLQLARQQKMPYQEFIELIFADEAARRDRVGSDLRSRTAHLDMSMRLESWDDTTNLTFDRQLWNELCSLRFLEQSASVLILGPVGVGKTMLATSLGHLATRRRHPAFFGRARSSSGSRPLDSTAPTSRSCAACSASTSSSSTTSAYRPWTPSRRTISTRSGSSVIGAPQWSSPPTASPRNGSA